MLHLQVKDYTKYVYHPQKSSLGNRLYHKSTKGPEVQQVNRRNKVYLQQFSLPTFPSELKCHGH